MKKDIKELMLSELTDELLSIGEKKFRAKQMYEWMHKKLAMDFEEMTNLSKALRENLTERYRLDQLELLVKEALELV